MARKVLKWFSGARKVLAKSGRTGQPLLKVPRVPVEKDLLTRLREAGL